jgi:predicted ATP-grasp superfamily ATP-dependent carboligase
MSAGCVAVVYPYSTGEGLGRALRKVGGTAVAIVPERAEAVGMANLRLCDAEWDGVIIDVGDLDALARRLDGIVGVLPGDESAVRMCDRLAARMRLPGNDPETSCCRTDKAAMQRAVAEAGLAYPQTTEAASLEAAQAAARQIGFPVVLKPPWSASSVGVRVCHNEQDVAAAWDAAVGKRNALGCLNHGLVVQQHLVGEKWTVDLVSVSVGDKPPQHFVTDVWREQVREVAGGGIAWGASFLVSDPEDADARTVAAYARSVLDAVRVVTGPANVEVMLTASGPYLIEVAARLAGIYPSELVEVVIGHSQLGCAAAAAIDPGRFLHCNQVGSCGLTVAQVWLAAPDDGYQLDGETLDQIRQLRTVVSGSSGLRPGAAVVRTVNTPTSPGHLNLLGSSQQIDADIRHIRKLEAESLYRRIP